MKVGDMKGCDMAPAAGGANPFWSLASILAFVQWFVHLVLSHIFCRRTEFEFDVIRQAHDGPWTCVVTGGTSGIGFRLARRLCSRGDCVVIAGPDPEVCRHVRECLRKEFPEARVEHGVLDLANEGSIAEFCAALGRDAASRPPLRLLVNNAGIMEPDLSLTEAGLERHFAVNCSGALRLTWELLKGRGRGEAQLHVVNISSFTHRAATRAQVAELILSQNEGRTPDLNPAAAYHASKLSSIVVHNMLHTQRHRLGLDFCLLHVDPGAVDTDLVRHWPLVLKWLFRVSLSGLWLLSPAPVAAERVLRASKLLPFASGLYVFAPSQSLLAPSSLCADPGLRRGLWDLCTRGLPELHKDWGEI